MATFSGITIAEELGLETRFERIMFRMTLPLSDILVNVEEALIKMHEVTLETEKLLETTRIDLSNLAPTADCSICGLIFNPSGNPPVHTSPPHCLPCRHVICGTCLTSWLAEAGSCPVCRHKLTRRVFVNDDTDIRNEAVARSILQQIFQLGTLYLLTNPADVTFRGFYNLSKADAKRGLVGDIETLELVFESFSTTFEDSAIQGPSGQSFKKDLWEREAARFTAGIVIDEWVAMMSGIESPPTDDYSGSEGDGDQSQRAASTASDDEEDENNLDLDDIDYEQCDLGE